MAVRPQPPSVHGAELGSPNRGRHSTKQISLLPDPREHPQRSKGSSVTSSLFVFRRGGLGILLPPTAWLPKGWTLSAGEEPPVKFDNDAEL